MPMIRSIRSSSWSSGTRPEPNVPVGPVTATVSPRSAGRSSRPRGPWPSAPAPRARRRAHRGGRGGLLARAAWPASCRRVSAVACGPACVRAGEQLGRCPRRMPLGEHVDVRVAVEVGVDPEGHRVQVGEDADRAAGAAGDRARRRAPRPSACRARRAGPGGRARSSSPPGTRTGRPAARPGHRSRAASGATKSPIAMIERASTACIAFLYSSICPRIEASRSTGSGRPTGRSTKTAETRLSCTLRSPGRRTDTGTIERTTSFSDDSSPRPLSRSRKPPVIAVRTTSLTVPPSAFRTALNSSNLPSVQAQRRCGPIGPLSERAVGRDGLLGQRGHGRGEPSCRTRPVPSPHAPRRRRSGTDDSCCIGWLIVSLTAPATTARRRRRAPRRPVLGLVVRGVGLEVEHQLHQVGAGDAVDHAVVDLGDDRPAVVGQALDQPQLPQRLGHVQALAEHPAGQVAQLLVAARAGHGGVPHVVQDLEVRVVDPQRPAELQRHRPHPLPVAGHQRQLAQQQPDHVAVGGRRARRRRPPTPRASGCSRSPRRRSSHRGRSSGPRSAPRRPGRGARTGAVHVVGWPLKLCVSPGHRNLGQMLCDHTSTSAEHGESAGRAHRSWTRSSRSARRVSTTRCG